MPVAPRTYTRDEMMAAFQRMSDDTGVPVAQLLAEEMRMELGKGKLWDNQGNPTPKAEALFAQLRETSLGNKLPGADPTPIGMQLEKNMLSESQAIHQKGGLGTTLNNLMQQDVGETRPAARIREGTSSLSQNRPAPAGGESIQYAPNERGIRRFQQTEGEWGKPQYPTLEDFRKAEARRQDRPRRINSNPSLNPNINDIPEERMLPSEGVESGGPSSYERVPDDYGRPIATSETAEGYSGGIRDILGNEGPTPESQSSLEQLNIEPQTYSEEGGRFVPEGYRQTTPESLAREEFMGRSMPEMDPMHPGGLAGRVTGIGSLLNMLSSVLGGPYLNMPSDMVINDLIEQNYGPGGVMDPYAEVRDLPGFNPQTGTVLA